MPDTRTDAELLASTADDPRAFGIFYERWEGVILAWMLRRVGGNADVAVDLTAEVFAAALGAAPRFERRHEDGSAAAWLFAIARNTLATSFRRGRVESQARQRLARWEPLDLDALDVAAIAQLGSDDSEVVRALEGLPPMQRAAVYSRVVQEREYDDIARELRCSSLVIRKNVSRGLAALRAAIQGGPTS